MDGKILINVLLPSLSQTLEVWVPVNLTFAQLNDLVGDVAKSVTRGQFTFDEKLLLCEQATGRPFALSKTPQDLGLGNGMKAMLI